MQARTQDSTRIWKELQARVGRGLLLPLIPGARMNIPGAGEGICSGKDAGCTAQV